MNRTLAGLALASALLASPATAQDARTEPTFEDMVQRTMSPKNCDRVDVEIYFVAERRWPPIAEVLRELIHHPENSKLHMKLGNEFGRLTLWPAAEAAYRCAILFDENNAHAWNNLGLVLLGRSAVQESIDALDRAITIDVNYARAHYHLGMAYDAAERYDDAIMSYERAVSLDPKLALARFNPVVASNPHRLELFMRRLISEQTVRYNLGDLTDD